MYSHLTPAMQKQPPEIKGPSFVGILHICTDRTLFPDLSTPQMVPSVFPIRCGLFAVTVMADFI